MELPELFPIGSRERKRECPSYGDVCRRLGVADLHALELFTRLMMHKHAEALWTNQRYYPSPSEDKKEPPAFDMPESTAHLSVYRSMCPIRRLASDGVTIGITWHSPRSGQVVLFSGCAVITLTVNPEISSYSIFVSAHPTRHTASPYTYSSEPFPVDLCRNAESLARLRASLALADHNALVHRMRCLAGPAASDLSAALAAIEFQRKRVIAAAFGDDEI